MPTYPGRCNLRQCQTRHLVKIDVPGNRRNDVKRLAAEKICSYCGKGHLYIDWYRFDKGDKDRSPECTTLGCRAVANTTKPHRIDNADCVNNAEYKLNIAMRGRVKNSPVQQDFDDEVPF